MSEKPSITIAGPIWRSFMLEALTKFPNESFTPPEKKLEPENQPETGE